MPAHIYQPGPIGLVSRSGTLNYEAVEQMNELGLGQTTSISIGGDPVNGCDFLTIMKEFARDDATEAVLMIGEIGGNQEVEAARWARDNMEKPLAAFIAGATAPPGRRMGHDVHPERASHHRGQRGKPERRVGGQHDFHHRCRPRECWGW